MLLPSCVSSKVSIHETTALLTEMLTPGLTPPLVRLATASAIACWYWVELGLWMSAMREPVPSGLAS